MHKSHEVVGSTKVSLHMPILHICLGFGAGVLAGCGFVAAIWGLSSLTTAQSLWVTNPTIVANRVARCAKNIGRC